VYLINDQFPGETIEARSGDRIIVNVTNCLGNEGLAMHWHGLRMEGANDMDGAVGLTQMPIPPGKNFCTISLLEMRNLAPSGIMATKRLNEMMGSTAGLIVHRPWDQCNEKEKYAYDQEILLLIGDWYHRSSTEVLRWYMNSRSFGNEPVPDSLVINGKGNFDCEMAVPARPLECAPLEERTGLPVLRLESGKHNRLRFVNTGSLTGFSFQMRNATISPFQVDGGNPITSAEAQRVGIVYPGERVDAILRTGSSDEHGYFEIEMDDENFKYPNPALDPIQTFPVKTVSSPGHERNLPRPENEYYNLQAAFLDSPSRFHGQMSVEIRHLHNNAETCKAP